MQKSAREHSRPVYLGYTQDELDRAYTQADWAPNMYALVQAWNEAGRSLRKPDLGYAEYSYGTENCERLDVFDAPGPIVHLHIHGGAWQRQSKEDCSFLAPAMRALGVPFVVPEFGKLPEYQMPEVLSQITEAVRWTYERFIKAGRANGIVLSGHSSGAHMAALVASQEGSATLPRSALRAVLCLSGAYDLQPVLLSKRRSYVQLSDVQARQLSPINRVSETRVPIHLVYGEKESPEFIRQSKAYAAALAAQGKLAVCKEVAGANHFEVVDQMRNAQSAVGHWLAALLSMPHSASDLPGALHTDRYSEVNSE